MGLTSFVPWSRPSRSDVIKREKAGELIHLNIKKLSRIVSVDYRITGPQSSVVQSSLWHWMGVRPCLHRGCLARRLRAGHGQPAQRECCRVPRGGCCLLCQPRRPRRTRDDRQRLVLSVNNVGAAFKRLGLRRIFTKPNTSGPTERPSGSSKRHCVSGPMREPTTTPNSDRRNYLTGFTATTGVVHILA